MAFWSRLETASEKNWAAPPSCPTFLMKLITEERNSSRSATPHSAVFEILNNLKVVRPPPQRRAKKTRARGPGAGKGAPTFPVALHFHSFYMPCAWGCVQPCCGHAVQMASTTWSPCVPLWANQNECTILTIDVVNASMPLEHSNKGVTRLPWAQIEVEKGWVRMCVTVCVTILIIVIIRLVRSVLLAHGPWSGFDTCVL